MTAGLLDVIETPNSTRESQRVSDAAWCADNGCFSEKWDEETWWQFLIENAGRADSCAFAVAPDVVGDAWASHLRAAPWLGRIRELGYRVAYVAQDGLENLPVPWHDFDVLFIGGTTEWKLGPHARALAAEAKARGKSVHMGRVNSLKRLMYADAIGCDSVDGTFLIFGPDVNLRRLTSWLSHLDNNPTLELA